MTEGAHPDKQTAIAYGCSLILLILVLFLSALAIFIRERGRTRYYA
jgi:phosphate transport system permease protein